MFKLKLYTYHEGKKMLNSDLWIPHFFVYLKQPKFSSSSKRSLSVSNEPGAALANENRTVTKTNSVPVQWELYASCTDSYQTNVTSADDKNNWGKEAGEYYIILYYIIYVNRMSKG